jgi:hypothetical protein
MWSSCWSPCPLHVITKGISCLASELMFIMFIQVFILLYLQLKTVFFRMSHGRAPTLNVGKMDKVLVYQICNFWCTFFKNLHFLQVESCLLWKFAQLGWSLLFFVLQCWITGCLMCVQPNNVVVQNCVISRMKSVVWYGKVGNNN